MYVIIKWTKNKYFKEWSFFYSEIYSFSYPLALDSFLSSYVHDWRTKIFQNFSYLELSWTQKIVNLDCIVLWGNPYILA